MKKKTKRIVIWTLALILIFSCLLWVGCLIKNCIITAMYKDEIHNMQFVGQEELLPEFDWYKITSYSDKKIEIYFVNTFEKSTDREYKIGGKMIFTKTPNGWYHTDMVDSILWSGAGSADDYIWPYWHHIFLS